MRLKSEIWIGALLRRVFAAGSFAAVERRGADEAGAVFVRVRHRDGLETLYAPAPQSVFETGRPEDRIFEPRLARQPAAAVDALLLRETAFDPDLWIVEVETDRPDDFMTLA